MLYDTIIIGSGPAGVTAGIYAVRREMKTLIIGKEPGGQLSLASEIENYPAFESIEAFELIQKMQEHVKSFGVEIKQSEVQEIEKKADKFVVHTSSEDFETKTVIIAMGLIPRRLAIPGEEEFSGRGVSYCANCDGPFFKDKTVVVAGGGNSALDAAEVLSKIAKKVYLIHRREDFKGFEILVDEVERVENIELILNTKIDEIIGKDKVTAVKVSDVETKEEKTIELDGVFIEIGRIAHTDLVADLVERDERSQIIVDESYGTKTPGVFAGGDVVAGDYKQITIAMGQATIAALSAYQYLQLKKGKPEQVIYDRSIRGRNL